MEMRRGFTILTELTEKHFLYAAGAQCPAGIQVFLAYKKLREKPCSEHRNILEC